MVIVAVLVVAVAANVVEGRAKGGPMKPIAPLMIEHRLIDRMVAVMEIHAAAAKETGKVDPAFIDTVVDFFRMYGDKAHHGKEEAILFRELLKKKISAAHKNILHELLAEHAMARKVIDSLAAAKERYIRGDKEALSDIVGALHKLTELYPKHIVKEDKHFFIPVMKYFSKGEQDAMLEEMWEYDRNMIHVKYRDVVGKLEQ